MAGLQQFTADIGKLQQDLLSIGRSAPLVMARAVNRAGTAGKTAMVKAVAADTGIQQKAITNEIRLSRASRSEPTFSVEVRGRRIPLIAFQARGPEPSRGRGRGVSYRLPTGRGNAPSAFIATMRTGHRGVFKRIGSSSGKSRGAWSLNLPIVELRGPSLPHVFEKHVADFFRAAEPSLLKNLASEISFARSKGAGAGEGA